MLASKMSFWSSSTALLGVFQLIPISHVVFARVSARSLRDIFRRLSSISCVDYPEISHTDFSRIPPKVLLTIPTQSKHSDIPLGLGCLTFLACYRYICLLFWQPLGVIAWISPIVPTGISPEATCEDLFGVAIEIFH